MSTPVTYVTIPASPETIKQLPPDPATRAQVLELGLRQWRIREALEDYRRRRGTLAYAAERAGVSVREIIPLAYAYGLAPPVDPAWIAVPLTLDQTANL